MITLRAITADDMPMLRAWAEKRDCLLLDEWLSPHGILALWNDEPVMCAWAATILETALMEIDHVYTTPRIRRAQGLDAWSAIIDGFRHLALCIAEAGGRKVAAFKIAANADMKPYIEATGGSAGAHPLLNCIYLA